MRRARMRQMLAQHVDAFAWGIFQGYDVVWC
jgi:hypothetical protein